MKKLMMTALVGSILTAGQVEAQETGTKPNWSENVTFKGDVRARFESIDEDGKDTRNRGRVRARFGAYAKVNDEVDAAIALASGEDDPVSTNQTLGEGFSSKGIRLDIASIDYHPEVLPGSLVLGKMRMPFIAVNDLQWDGDLNPEGAALQLELPANDNIAFLLNGGGFYVMERGSDSETMLYGAQAAVKLKSDGFKVLGGASYFTYDNIEGYGTIVDSTKGFGNTVDKDADGLTTYTTGFDIVELFTELGFDVGAPVVLAGNYVINQDADDDDKGFMVGFTVGKLKDPGSFQFGYSYRELEANAVLGAFADSDAWGGGTDGTSHKLNLGYQIAKNLAGSVTYFISEKGIDSDVDYNRLQVDLSARF